MTITVAVTGGIGAGKSTVSGLLAERGAIVVDSDRLAREAVDVGTSGLLAIKNRFGEAVIAENGSLNRPALASIVFTDPAARQDLEGIIHPLVRARFEAIRVQAPSGSVVVNDIPLLTTVAAAASFHLVVGVYAAESARITRLVERGLTDVDARARIAAQISDAARRSLCDLWIDNNSTPAAAQQEADQLWCRLAEFAANVELAQVAADEDRAVVSYRSEWPAIAARLSARIERATGLGPARHVGPTSIPGQAAPDRVELELTLENPGDGEALKSGLIAAGLPPRRGNRPGGLLPRGGQSRRRLGDVHGNADPGQSLSLYFTVRS